MFSIVVFNTNSSYRNTMQLKRHFIFSNGDLSTTLREEALTRGQSSTAAVNC
jgi:hypothetical protein